MTAEYRWAPEDASRQAVPPDANRSDRQPAIEMIDVVKRFEDRSAVDHVTLKVRQGEVFGLLGPNGSGKTTTVNLLTGLTRLSSGRVQVLGFDVATHADRIRAALGAVPQETALYEELTALHNLRLHANLHFLSRRVQRQRINDALDLVKLSNRRDSQVRTFSGGMKRRLALARALLHDPELLLLDEPTLGVDVQSRRALWDHILELRALGKTVLITTNYLEEANALCDRLAILDNGRLVALDSPAALRARFGVTRIVVNTLTDLAVDTLELIRHTHGVLDVRGGRREVTVAIDGHTGAKGAVITAIAGTNGIAALDQTEPSLDDVFLGLTGHALRD